MRLQRLGKWLGLTGCVACMAAFVIASGLTGCATISKTMDSIKNVMKIYDTYEKPVSDLAEIVGITTTNEEEK